MKLKSKRHTNLKIPRSAGILCHPTSFSTIYGIGDFGPKAYKFIDFMFESNQKYWQVLPLGPTGYGNSPYQTFSAFAGNPLLISPAKLVDDGLINQTILTAAFNQFKEENQFSQDKRINYGLVLKLKEKIVKISFKFFLSNHGMTNNLFNMKNFMQFCEKENYWLEEYCLYQSIKQENDLKSWIFWPQNLKNREKSDLISFKQSHMEDLEYHRFVQWLFSIQWFSLKQYANEKGVQIIGDMPIFVSHDSSDVWGHPEYFLLNTDGTLEFQAGVPPDYFSETGQLWGNPLYNWNLFKKNKFSWFTRRFQRMMQIVDWIRVDHFRGFESFWRILGDETTAINGKWIKAPGKKLFKNIKKVLGKLPIIAEDLGIITPEVKKLRKYFSFPGMRVIQFGFDNDRSNVHLPHNFEKNSVVYTGTHDNDTTLGWWEHYASDNEKEFLKQYFETDAKDINSVLIEALYRSNANLTVIPIQDFLRESSGARMNIPNSTEGNWEYLFDISSLNSNLIKWIKCMTEEYGRINSKTE